MASAFDTQQFRSGIDVEEAARQQGNEDRPRTSDRELDATQQAVVTYYRERHRELADGVVDREAALAADTTGWVPPDFENLWLRAEADVRKVQAEVKTRMGPLFRTLRRAQGDLKNFRHTHGLHDRAAHYPPSLLYHFALVAAVLVLESLANAYFFAQGSDLGLLGGALQALLVSLVNVAMAVTVGYFVLGQTNHVDAGRHRWAWVGFGAYVVIALGFNLTTAHYRDLLATTTGDVGTDGLTQSLAEPWAMSFHSILLFTIGVLVAVFSLYKGYKADDPYPGYGRLTREAKAEREVYLAEKGRVLADWFRPYHDLGARIDALLEESRQRPRRIEERRAELEKSVPRYHDGRKGLEAAARLELQRYRDANVRFRSSPPPAYFEEYPVFEPSPKVDEERIATVCAAVPDSVASAVERHEEVVAAAGVYRHRVRDAIEGSERALDLHLEGQGLGFSASTLPSSAGARERVARENDDEEEEAAGTESRAPDVRVLGLEGGPEDASGEDLGYPSAQSRPS